MNKKVFWEILIGIVALTLLLVFLMNTVAEPWAKNKIESLINKKSGVYELQIDNVDFLIFPSGFVLNKISLVSKQTHDSLTDLSVEVESLKLSGVKLMKALFKKEIDIREVTVFNGRVNGQLSFDAKQGSPMISPLSIKIEKLIVDTLLVAVKSTTSPQSYRISEGQLSAFSIQLAKMDTLSLSALGQVEFSAKLFSTVLSDSMYTISVVGVSYDVTTNSLKADTISYHPNYSDAEFTARYTYRKARIDAEISQPLFRDFSVMDFVKSGNIICSSVEMAKLDMQVLVDVRKRFSPENKPVFQEKVNNFPHLIAIDSIGVYSGRIVYSELVEEGNHPSEVWLDGIDVRLFNMTNDPIYKTEKGELEFRANAFFMGKAKMHLELKGRLYEPSNTFELSGHLSSLDALELNPIIERHLSVFVSSGTIDALYFNYTANNTQATGDMELRYHDLKLTATDKFKDNNASIKERIITGIANLIVMDANPRPGEKTRSAAIYFKREPEAPFFSYCSKSLLSGIKPSLIERQKKEKK